MQQLSLFILAVMVVLWAGCGNQPADSGTQRKASFETILEGGIMGHQGEERQVVITNQSQWQQFRGSIPNSELVAVDFEKDMVIAIVLPGSKSRVSIRQVTKRDNAIIVTYEVEVPGPNCIYDTGAIPGSLYCVITTDRTSKPIQYVKQVITRSCE